MAVGTLMITMVGFGFLIMNGVLPDSHGGVLTTTKSTETSDNKIRERQ
jgi:hypothetical protein